MRLDIHCPHLSTYHAITHQPKYSEFGPFSILSTLINFIAHNDAIALVHPRWQPQCGRAVGGKTLW